MWSILVHSSQRDKDRNGAAVILKILCCIESRYIENRRNVTEFIPVVRPSLLVYLCDFQRVIDGTKFQDFGSEER